MIHAVKVRKTIIQAEMKMPIGIWILLELLQKRNKNLADLAALTIKSIMIGFREVLHQE